MASGFCTPIPKSEVRRSGTAACSMMTRAAKLLRTMIMIRMGTFVLAVRMDGQLRRQGLGSVVRRYRSGRIAAPLDERAGEDTDIHVAELQEGEVSHRRANTR